MYVEDVEDIKTSHNRCILKYVEDVEDPYYPYYHLLREYNYIIVGNGKEISDTFRHFKTLSSL